MNELDEQNKADVTRLLLAGDLMLGRGVNEEIRRRGPGYPLEPLAPITRAADLFCANLECAISPVDRIWSGASKPFCFRADPVAVQTLNYAGIRMVSLANNHALDADYGGLLDTVRILGAHEISHAGAGRNIEAAREPAIIAIKGRRVGLLSCCDHQADFAADRKHAGIWHVDVFDGGQVETLLAATHAATESVDHLIVAFHWQHNWSPVIQPVYRDLARRLADAGARVIWGHSPHHFQGVEWIGPSVALFSTGDFLDDYAVDPEFRNDLQLLFELELGSRGIERVRALPLELEFARTRPAMGASSEWIERRFVECCRDTGSTVKRDEEWFVIEP